MSRYQHMIDEMNYYNDPRTQARRRGKWYTAFNKRAMRCHISTYDPDQDDGEISGWVPVHYEVCDLCRGRGKHVNPSIDCGGITAEDFDYDPEFETHYYYGTYDTHCYGCDGEKVVPEIDSWEFLTDEQRKLVEALRQQQEDDAMYEAEVAAERRMGC